MMSLAIAPSPLLAAGLDWLEALLPVLFVLFWILSQVFAVVKRVAGGGEAARPAAPPVRRLRPVVAEREVARDLQDEIRDFLRRETSDHRPEAPTISRPPPRPRPVTPRPVAARPMPQVSRLPQASQLSGGSIAEKVKEDFEKELEHLSTPLTADRVLVSPQPGSAVGAGSPTAAIVRSLRSPAMLRELVVIREILDRPVDRW